MKKFAAILIVALSLLSCKNVEKKTDRVESSVSTVENKKVERTFSGEFIHTPDASVFSGSSFIYGVMMNEVAQELAKRVDAVKKDDSDFVPVTVKGEISRKPEGTEGWDEIITITQIISVSDTPKEADVKI